MSELILDAHLDLAMNAIEWNRDLKQTLDSIRAAESGQHDKPDRGNGVVSLQAMREGGVGLCLATQIARYSASDNPLPGWSSPEIAWGVSQAQLAWYRAMESQGWMRAIRDRTTLRQTVDQWKAWLAQGRPDPPPPIGYVLTLEGADSLVTLDYLEQSYAAGLRCVGLSHYGPGRYAPGTGCDGPLEPAGRDLLREMDRLNMALDVTHLTDAGFLEALEHFDGPVWASHHNCRALTPDQRQLTDEQIRALIARDAVIGAACDAWMLKPNWIRGVTTPQAAKCTLEDVANHIDHVCQIAGNTRHAGIGSDLDGGFGREQCPLDIDAIGDLAGLRPILAARGYSEQDIAAIMSDNWLRRLDEALPD